MGSKQDVRGSQAPAWYAMMLSVSVPNDSQNEGGERRLWLNL